MGVTAGELSDTECLDIVVTFRGPLDEDDIALLNAALTTLVGQFNAEGFGRIEIVP